MRMRGWSSGVLSSQNESFFGRVKCATEPVRLTILLAAHLLQPLHVEGQRLWRGPRVERAAREAALADQAVVHDDGAGGGHVNAEFGRNLDQIVAAVLQCRGQAAPLAA